MDKCVLDCRSQKWLEIIAACNRRDPSQSKQDWCFENGIQRRQFYYWQKNLRCRVAEALSSDLVPIRQQKTVQGSPFVDVTAKICQLPGGSVSVEESHALNENSSFAAEILLEIGGVKVWLGEDFHEQTLKKVLRVLNND